MAIYYGAADTVVCLAFGERGESAKLWKQPGMTTAARRLSTAPGL